MRVHCMILFDLEDNPALPDRPRDPIHFSQRQTSLSDAVKVFLFQNKTRKCVVYGLSMEPFLSFGETVVIVQCAWPLKKGHCYAFISGKTLTIHRFIKFLNNDYALFAGDNNLFCDRVPIPYIVGELFPCQNRCAVFIIEIINLLFYALMQIFTKSMLLRRARRRIIRSINGWKKKELPIMKKKYEKPEMIIEVMSLDMLEGGCSGHQPAVSTSNNTTIHKNCACCGAGKYVIHTLP